MRIEGHKLMIGKRLTTKKFLMLPVVYHVKYLIIYTDTELGPSAVDSGVLRSLISAPVCCDIEPENFVRICPQLFEFFCSHRHGR